MLPASPRRALTGAAIAALVVGSLALSAPAFADESSAPVPAPALTFPAAGDTVSTDFDLHFQWAPSAGATQYRFELGGGDPQLGTGLQVVTGTSVTVRTPSSAGSAFWRVTAVGPGGSAVSETRTVRFASQAPDAGVGTPVTVTAPAPAAPTAPAPVVPAASAQKASAPAAPAPSSSAPSMVTAPEAAVTTSAAEPDASSVSTTPTSEAVADTGSSGRALSDAEPTTARAAATPAVPVTSAIVAGVGIAMLVVVALRLIVLRRARD